MNQPRYEMGVDEEKEKELICHDWLSSLKKDIFSKGYQWGRDSKNMMWFRSREFGHDKCCHRSLGQLI